MSACEYGCEEMRPAYALGSENGAMRKHSEYRTSAVPFISPSSPLPPSPELSVWPTWN